MKDRPFRNYSDEVLAWWVATIDRGFDPMCKTCKDAGARCSMCPPNPPEIQAAVKEEFARRSPNAKARPTKNKRGTNV